MLGNTTLLPDLFAFQVVSSRPGTLLFLDGVCDFLQSVQQFPDLDPADAQHPRQFPFRDQLLNGTAGR